MVDRAEVISQLERCTLQTDLPIRTHRDACAICHYKRDGRCNFTSLMADALALLKAQEKVKVVYTMMDTECGNCGCYLDKTYSVCPQCGKELDWNA